MQCLRGWLGAAALLLAAPTAAGASVTPSQVVDGLHAVLIDVMREATALGYEGRAAKLAPAIPEFYDVGFMAEKSVGRHWKTADEADRDRFQAAFLRFMVANYAGQFDGFSGQHFETLGEEPAPMDTVLVRSRLVNPKKENVALNYRMHQVGGRWKIIDVYLDGTVSELALRRSEFSGIVKREDFDALIAAIDARIEALASGAES
jgi:phospholipid transport system substrate-binding protein